MTDRAVFSWKRRMSAWLWSSRTISSCVFFPRHRLLKRLNVMEPPKILLHWDSCFTILCGTQRMVEASTDCGACYNGIMYDSNYVCVRLVVSRYSSSDKMYSWISWSIIMWAWQFMSDHLTCFLTSSCHNPWTSIGLSNENVLHVRYPYEYNVSEQSPRSFCSVFGLLIEEKRTKNNNPKTGAHKLKLHVPSQKMTSLTTRIDSSSH